MILALTIFVSAVHAETYRLVPEESYIKFQPDARFGSGAGEFHKFTVNADITPSEIEKSLIEVVIDVSSIDTGIKKRDKHLLTPDFFDAAAHPTATLKIPGVERRTSPGYLAKAELTIRGVAKNVDLPFLLEPSGDSLRATGTTVIRRKEFGIAYDSRMNPIKDEVQISYQLTLKK